MPSQEEEIAQNHPPSKWWMVDWKCCGKKKNLFIWMVFYTALSNISIKSQCFLDNLPQYCLLFLAHLSRKWWRWAIVITFYLSSVRHLLCVNNWLLTLYRQHFATNLYESLSYILLHQIKFQLGQHSFWHLIKVNATSVIHQLVKQSMCKSSQFLGKCVVWITGVGEARKHMSRWTGCRDMTTKIVENNVKPKSIYHSISI